MSTPGERMAGVDPLPQEQEVARAIRGHRDATDPDASILAEALDLVTGDRNAAYGPPEVDHSRAAAIFNQITGANMGAVEVELMLLAVKLARMGQHYRGGVRADGWRDSVVDLAGYAHCLARGLAAERP